MPETPLLPATVEKNKNDFFSQVWYTIPLRFDRIYRRGMEGDTAISTGI